MGEYDMHKILFWYFKLVHLYCGDQLGSILIGKVGHSGRFLKRKKLNAEYVVIMYSTAMLIKTKVYSKTACNVGNSRHL